MSKGRSGLILAGGLSSRMGRDKGLLDLEGRPLVAWVIERMRPAVDEVVVSTSTANDAAYREAVPEDVRCIPDVTPQRGPLGGWRSALPALRGEHLAMAPCDAPLYSPTLAVRLFDLVRGHDGAVPRLGRYFEPLHGVYHRERLLAAVDKTLAVGLDRPVHTYAHLDILEVEEPAIRAIDPELDSFRGVNTPDELEVVRRRVAALPLGDARGPTPSDVPP